MSRFVIALEEHFTAKHLLSRIPQQVIADRHFRPARVKGPHDVSDLLPEIGPLRIQLMDESGIDMQVLSHGGPGADLVEGPNGVDLAREINDFFGHQDRGSSDPLCWLRASAAAISRFGSR